MRRTSLFVAAAAASALLAGPADAFFLGGAAAQLRHGVVVAAVEAPETSFGPGSDRLLKIAAKSAPRAAANKPLAGDLASL